MTGPDRPLLATGRRADVFDLGDGTVLKRYRTDAPGVEDEARVMQFVADQGFPVPAVLTADGRELVMAKVEGPSMAADLHRRPTSALAHARRLAGLQRDLAAIPAPEWLMAPGWIPDPAEDRVLHLDLHPGSVLLSAEGAIVIDWAVAAAGPPGFDAAMTYVAMHAAAADTRARRIANRVLIDAFRRLRGPEMIDAFAEAACDHRLADPLLPPEERVVVGELRAKLRA